MNTTREVKQVINGLKTADGDGVQLTRLIGSAYLDQLDPFLLFDAFGSDKPQDYIGGFPPHPHRGFETVTYMHAGKMRHKDSAGNEGVIEAGGVQWMTAGKGIIHSEMPEQEEGLLAGFQLWVNLPATHKMTEPKYQEYTSTEILQEIRSNDNSDSSDNDHESSKVTVIAGTTCLGTKGVIDNDLVSPIYWDVKLPAKASFEDLIAKGLNAFIYVVEGEVIIGDKLTSVNKGQLAVLKDGCNISIKANTLSQFLVVAGKPINEPVERGGPFVMNTKAEIQQAFKDYQNGEFA